MNAPVNITTDTGAEPLSPVELNSSLRCIAEAIGQLYVCEQE